MKIKARITIEYELDEKINGVRFFHPSSPPRLKDHLAVEKSYLERLGEDENKFPVKSKIIDVKVGVIK